MARQQRAEDFGYIIRHPAPQFDIYNYGALELLAHGQPCDGERITSFHAPPSFHLRAPLTAFVEVTDRCNLSCRYCYIPNRSSNEPELSTAELLHLLDELAAMETFLIVFTGGEPLLRPDLAELVNHALAVDLEATIITNGSLITPGRIADIDRRARFSVSVDGITRNKDSRGLEFDVATSALQTIRDSGFRVALLCTMNRLTLGESINLFDWCRHNRFRFVTYDCQPLGRALDDDEVLLRESDVPEAMALFRHIAHVRGLPEAQEWADWEQQAIDSSSFTQLMRLAYRFEVATRRCKGSRAVTYVTSTGEVYPCSNCRSRELFPAGSIRQTSFRDIWNHGFNSMRAIGWDDVTGCRSCELSRPPYICKFRCPPLSAALNDGNLDRCGAAPYIKEMLRLRTLEPT